MVKAGILGEKTLVVTELMTAAAVGSGGLPVFATPSLVALMEGVAMQSVQPYLAPGEGTVGASIEVRHTAPTPTGHTVTCRSTLTKVDGKRLTFAIEAFDEGGPIGTATHLRVIINDATFMQRAHARFEGGN